MMSFSLSGGVEVLGFISPTDPLDTYPVIDPIYGIDGFRNVDLISDLDLIPNPRRRAGMVVGISGGTQYYKLNPSPWNGDITDWSVFNTELTGNYLPLSGGSVTGNTTITGVFRITGNTITYGNLTSLGEKSTYIATPLTINPGDYSRFIQSYYLKLHPEGSNSFIPYFINDIGYLTLRGGSVTSDYSGLTQTQVETIFDGTPKYAIFNPSLLGTGMTLNISFGENLNFTNILVISFGAANWRSQDFTIELSSGGTYSILDVVTGFTESDYSIKFSLPQGNTFDGCRITFSNFFNTSSPTGFRIADISLVKFNSNGPKSLYVGRDGGEIYKQIQITGGTTTTPSYSTLNDTNTGMYFPTGGTVGFVTNGVERMRINSSGNVGIGTTTPSTLLDVQGSNSTYFRFSPTTSGGRVLLSGTTNTTSLPAYTITVPISSGSSLSADAQFGIVSFDTITRQFGNPGDTYLRSSSRSNGLNLITEPLVGTGTTEDYIRFYAGQNASGATPDIHIQGTGTTRGFVGIGTSNPITKLHVSGDTIISSGLTATTISATTYQNLPSSTNIYNTDGTLTGARSVNLSGNQLTFSSTTSGTNVIGLYGSGNTSTSRTYFEMGQRNNGGFSSSVFFTSFAPSYSGTSWGSFYSGSSMLSAYHENPVITGGFGNLYFDISQFGSTVANRYFAWHAAPVTTARSLSTEMMRLHILGNGDGNLGINTKGVPTQKLHVSGNTLIEGSLTANTISATTYQNLPTDVRVTGGTYSSGTATFTNNTGGTFSVSGFSTSSYGVVGISNSLGIYTYYSTISDAMSAATSGQTIEMFADIVETNNVEITLKNGVNIQGNGHTYTLNNSGLIHAFKTSVSDTVNCSILNVNVIRAGSTGTTTNNACLYLNINSTGSINCSGSIFRNTGSGCGIAANSLTFDINYATAYATTIWGAIGIATSNDIRLNHCVGYGTSGGFGIRCQNGGNVSNCIGYSDSGTGFYGDAGRHSNCVGVSVSGTGFQGAGGSGGYAINCIGRSTSGVGFDATNGTNLVNCTGISVSGVGLTSNLPSTHNCTGISNSSRGVTLTGSAIAYNITAKSISSYALLSTTSTNKIYGGNLISEWNDAAGYGLIGSSGSITSVITNCVIRLANSSAPYIFNGGIAASISMKGNTYTGGASFNPNITQAITSTQDNQGNIYL